MSLQNELLNARDRIVQLQARSSEIANFLPRPPKDLEISDADMIALEGQVSCLTCRVLDVRAVDPGIWRPFWQAAYSDWGSRAEGPSRFWELVQHHLRETERHLDSLLRHEGHSRCPSCGALIDHK